MTGREPQAPGRHPGPATPAVDGAHATGPARHHGNRHGRSEEARTAILEAADDLLAERGFAGVTIEGIAARAGVAKQTIYRWWNSKADILFEALATDAGEHFTPADHGDLGSDLRDHLRQIAVFLTETDAGAVCRALAAQAQLDAAVADRFEAEFLAPQRDRDRAPFLRARRRGELAPGTDIDLAIDQLVGPIYYRVLVTGRSVPPRFTDALVASFLARTAVH
ncbi:MAG TPA: TetR/AcrR family transcriptional regulator [Streptosporangiaceae bacterium]|nr:TetR/AcrR family transcriptional regulator [Streptosporangiaceae bacterium]